MLLLSAGSLFIPAIAPTANPDTSLSQDVERTLLAAVDNSNVDPQDN